MSGDIPFFGAGFGEESPELVVIDIIVAQIPNVGLVEIRGLW
jgi:hypothetical protein